MHHACRIPACSHRHRGHKGRTERNKRAAKAPSGIGSVKQNSFGCAPTADPQCVCLLARGGFWQQRALRGKIPSSAAHGWPDCGRGTKGQCSSRAERFQAGNAAQKLSEQSEAMAKCIHAWFKRSKQKIFVHMERERERKEKATTKQGIRGFLLAAVSDCSPRVAPFSRKGGIFLQSRKGKPLNFHSPAVPTGNVSWE